MYIPIYSLYVFHVCCYDLASFGSSLVLLYLAFLISSWLSMTFVQERYKKFSIELLRYLLGYRPPFRQNPSQPASLVPTAMRRTV